MKKKLTYIVNKITENDSQHYVHIPNLLTKLNRYGWDTTIISERGGTGVKETFGHNVHYLSREGRWSRLPRLIMALLKMRAAGGKLVFVRISKSAAIVSAILGRLLGWHTLFWISGTVEDFDAQKGGFKYKFRFFGMWMLVRTVNYMVTGPESMIGYYSKIYNIPKSKIILLYNDIDLRDNLNQSGSKLDDIHHILMVL